jgi:hypothetical protein
VTRGPDAVTRGPDAVSMASKIYSIYV